MLINNRVILKDNAVLSDISAQVCDPREAPTDLVIVAAEDALYIGSDLPFNHRFFMLEKKNEVAGSVAVAVWDGSAFTACEDVQDLTAVGGVPFARSGLIRFALPQNVGWYKVYDSSEIAALSTLKVKASYWIRLTFSAAFDFALQYVGFRFAKDSDLAIYYPDLQQDSVRRAYAQGVPMANWDKLHVEAAEELLSDLRAEDVICSANQVLNPELFMRAAVHKMAEMAYSGLVRPEQREFAQGKYKKAMALKIFDVDTNKNGRLETAERIGEARLVRT